MNKLVYIFPCPQYPNGYICYDLGLVKEYFEMFEEINYLRKGRCILSNNEIYTHNLPFMWLKEGVKKHARIIKRWKSIMAGEEPFHINLHCHLWGDLACMLAPMNKAIHEYVVTKYGVQFDNLEHFASPLLTFDAANEIVKQALNDTKLLWEKEGLSEIMEDMEGKLVENCYGYESEEEEQCAITGIPLLC